MVIETSSLTPQECAEKLLYDLKVNLSCQINPYDIAEELLGRPVDFEDVKGFDGLLLSLGEKSAIVVNSSIREEERKRFTCAHEIGHYVLTSHKKEGVSCTEDDIFNLNKKKHLEYEANEFASELLILTKTFKKIIDGEEPRKELIEELSERFGTSLTATVWKYVTVCELNCALVVSKDTRTIWCAKSEFFTPFIQLAQPVWEGTYAYNFYRGKNIPNEFCEVDAELWVEGRGINEGTKVLELSIPQPFYNQVLTILWFEQDFEELEYEDYEHCEDEFDRHLKKKWRD